MFIFNPGAFCYAELGTIIKESGADYSYLYAAFPAVVSFSFSWVVNVLIKPAGCAAMMLSSAQYTLILFYDDGCGSMPVLHVKLLAVCFTGISEQQSGQ